MYNGSTRQEILQEVLERLAKHGLKVKWSSNGKEIARLQNVSVDDPSRLSEDYTASVSRSGKVVLWNEGKKVTFPYYVRRVLSVLRVEDREIQELINGFTEDGGVSFFGSSPEKIKIAFERIKGYTISDDLAEFMCEYGVMVLLKESLEEDLKYIRGKLTEFGYQEAYDRLYRRFSQNPREFILVPVKNREEITGFYVRWKVITEEDLKHENISLEGIALRMTLGDGGNKSIILTEGVIDALVVHFYYPYSIVQARSGWDGALMGMFFIESGGKLKLREDIEEFRIAVAYDKDKAGENYGVEVVEKFGFVATYEWIWKGQGDIDEVLVKGAKPVEIPAVRFYLKSFQREIERSNYKPACVEAFIQERNMDYPLTKEELIILLALFPSSKILKNYSRAFGINIGRSERIFSYCSSGLLSRYCPLQKCESGQGVIVGKLELEAVEPTEREFRIKVYYAKGEMGIKQETIYTKLKNLEEDITGTAGFLKLKEPVKSIAKYVLGEQASLIAEGLKNIQEDFVGERLKTIIKEVLAEVRSYELKEDSILVSYTEFTELVKTHAKYRRGDIKEMERRKLIKKTTKQDGNTIKHVYAVPKEFITGLESKYEGHGESIEADLKTFMYHIANREEIASGKAEHFVDRNLSEILDELRKGKVVVITTGEEDFEWFTLDMSDIELQEYLKRYKNEGVYYVAVAMKNGVLHKVDLNERPIEIEEEDLGEELNF